MKLCLASDFHGWTPKIPACDALLLAGDLEGTNNPLQQVIWMEKQMHPWMLNVIKKHQCNIYGIAGNHSWCYSPQFSKYLRYPALPWLYLEDCSVTFKGYNIYGSPWQPVFCDWAFNLTEEQLWEKYRNIPDNTEILISHGPPRGFGDMTTRGEEVGSTALRERIKELKELQLLVCGHIHEGYGEYNFNGVKIINASVVNEMYELANAPIIVELPDKG